MRNSKEYNRLYYLKNKEKVIAKNRKWAINHKDFLKEYSKKRFLSNSNLDKEKIKAKNLRYRIEVLNHYSNGLICCNCCGERNLEFLTLDHINNDGAKHRKEITKGNSVIHWVRANNFPEGFQVLCMNCNWAKSKYHGCPHKKLLT